MTIADIAAAYRDALAAGDDRPSKLAAWLADDVTLRGPFGVGAGKADVLESVAGRMLNGLVAAASWSEAEEQDGTIVLTAELPDGVPIGSVVSTLTVRDELISEITQEFTPAAPPPPSEMTLSDEIRSAVHAAGTGRHPPFLAYVDDAGVPHISFRGSTHVHSDDQLTIWVRDPKGGLLRAIGSHPVVALFLHDPERRLTYEFEGRAHRVTDATVRRRVYDESPERDRNVDPRRRGEALIIDLDRVEGGALTGKVRLVRT